MFSSKPDLHTYYGLQVLDTFGIHERFKRDWKGKPDYKAFANHKKELQTRRKEMEDQVIAAGFNPRRWEFRTEKEAKAMAERVKATCGFDPHLYPFSYL